MHLLPNSAYIDLKTLALSGQIFRMHPFQDKVDMYTIVHRNTVILLHQKAEEIYFQTYPVLDQIDLVYNLFRVGVNIDELHTSLKRDLFSTHAVNATGKLWLLEQDHWEILISFIISQNKHFLHIQQCIETLCLQFGKQIDTDIGTYFLFPTPESLANTTLPEISSCKVGYRDVYIQRAAQRIVDNPTLLKDLERMTNEQAIAVLTDFYGIGGKVADCILVFGYGRDDLVPYDTWIRRLMHDLYDTKENANYESLRAFNESHFGKFAGWVQQYMFFHARRVHKRGISLKETWFNI